LLHGSVASVARRFNDGTSVGYVDEFTYPGFDECVQSLAADRTVSGHGRLIIVIEDKAGVSK
jgi:hypothetical protein